MKRVIKAISLILAICMVIAAIPLSVQAATSVTISGVTIGPSGGPQTPATLSGGTYSAGIPEPGNSDVVVDIILSSSVGQIYHDGRMATKIDDVWQFSFTASEKAAKKAAFSLINSDGSSIISYSISYRTAPDIDINLATFVINGQYGATVIEGNTITITVPESYRGNEQVPTVVTSSTRATYSFVGGGTNTQKAYIGNRNRLTVTSEAGDTKDYQVILQVYESQTSTPTPTPNPTPTPVPSPTPEPEEEPDPIPDPEPSPDPEPEEPSQPINFTDVSAGAYYAEAVQWAIENGITSGTGNGRFSPNMGCTRAQAVTFLWRVAGSPIVSGGTGFSDVSASAYYANAVKWAVQNGITSGTGNGKFSPDAVCTRAQIVTFQYRAAGQPNVAIGNYFADVPSTQYFAKAVIWAVLNGVTSGTGGLYFSPNMTCTRGQIVTFLYREEFPIDVLISDEDNLVTLAFSKEATYGRGGRYSTATYSIPHINIISTDVDRINKEIYDNLYPVIETSISQIDDYGYPFDSDYMDYKWAVNYGILSLVISARFDLDKTPEMAYWVYNISVSSGGLLSAQETYSIKGLSPSEYHDLAKQVMGSKFFDTYYPYYSTTEADFVNRLSFTISDDNVNKASPYLNENGELCIIASIGSLVAASQYDWDLNMETYQVNENYRKYIAGGNKNLSESECLEIARNYWAAFRNDSTYGILEQGLSTYNGTQYYHYILRHNGTSLDYLFVDRATGECWYGLTYPEHKTTKQVM